mgnify:CR=1 FL=1
MRNEENEMKDSGFELEIIEGDELLMVEGGLRLDMRVGGAGASGMLAAAACCCCCCCCVDVEIGKADDPVPL